MGNKQVNIPSNIQMAKHLKRCLILLIIREMKITTIIKYHLTPVRMATIKKIHKIASVAKDVEKLKPSCTVCENIKQNCMVVPQTNKHKVII